MKHVLILLVAIFTSAYLFIFNDYMHTTSVRVEVVDKSTSSGSKGRIIREIQYKREDGRIFNLSAGEYAWQAASPGVKAWVQARPRDMEPSIWGDFRYMMLPVIVAVFTGVYLIFFLVFSTPLSPTQEKKFVQPSTKGPFEK